MNVAAERILFLSVNLNDQLTWAITWCARRGTHRTLLISDSWVSNDWMHCPERMSHTFAFLSQPWGIRGGKKERSSLHNSNSTSVCVRERENSKRAEVFSISHVFWKSNPRDKGVGGLRGSEVQAKHISCMTVETLEQLPTFHVPQCTRSIATRCQDLK